MSLVAVLRAIPRRMSVRGWPGRRRRPTAGLIEVAARVGYGAQGFVYLSAGLLTLLAAFDVMGRAAGSQEATFWVARQPLARLWLVLLGLGLAAFAQWCLLQSVFDADNEGQDRKAMFKRAGRGTNGLVHAALAVTAIGLVFRGPGDPAASQQAHAEDAAARILALPFGDAILVAVGLAVVGTGLATAFNGLREDFTVRLSCSETLGRRIAPLAKAGAIARGVSLVPLGVFILLGGLHSRSSEVRSFGAALDGLQAQPGGVWVLAFTGLGLAAFGLFSFIEAKYRRIRPPREFSLT